MTIEFVVEQLISLIPVIGNLSKRKRELADNALRAISHALTETSIYYEKYSKAGQRNKETEEMLVRYWSAAAIPLRHINQGLSEICELKSEYWLNPEEWNEEKANGIAIDLETVREKYRVELNRRSSKAG